MRVVILILAVILCPLRSALAWGDTGHRIICEIAFQELTDAARQRVNQLVRLDHDFGTPAPGLTTRGNAPTSTTSTSRATTPASSPTNAPWPTAAC